MTQTTQNKVPMIKLNDGFEIPQLGFGTLNVPADRSGSPEASEKTASVILDAIEVGYRHFDTAQMYGNEKGVGLGIIKSGLPREEFFVTSKLSNANHKPDDVRRSFDDTMEKIGLGFLDLFLIHWPLPTLYDGDFVSTWKAMAELVKGGQVRSIGVSNFLPEHLDRVIRETGITPAINQVEVHPGFSNTSVVDASKRHGIVVEAWSPLGQGKILTDELLAQIAQRHGKTPAQVILRWHIQHGYVIFPKSMNRSRMEENFEIFDFELSPEEMAQLDQLDKGEEGRIGPNPAVFDWIPSAETPNPVRH